ncbi:MAG TPA: AAA family ATPase, partial [Caldimonas sp.]|nr:AAA family ATPase [Caldimonas sp.]
MLQDDLTDGTAQERRLTVLVEDGPLVMYRGWREPGIASALIAVVPTADPPPASILDRLAREHELADELDGAWALHPRALVREGTRTVLLLDDPGGLPLESLLTEPLELGIFLRIAIGTAVALGKVHQRGLVHREIKPANLIVQDSGEEVRITGFGIASRHPRERRAPATPDAIAGALAYMSPEQTGRMNRSVDARSDLYSLGVTLYRALTGTLPFSASDPMEWIHCHVARNAPAPSERVPHLPSVVSALVMKLLAKTAEERYQTATGLEHDLRRCIAQWEAHRRVEPFALAERDTPDRLLIPERLYGRERETAALLASFRRMSASGAPELVLVSGPAGIGKSTLVSELHKSLVPARGLFAAGKFERYRGDVPYATLAQAFQGLVRSLLAKSDAELAGWRAAIEAALGTHGALVCELVPELRHVIGDPPPVPPLPAQDAQARVHLVLRRFIGAFARPEHPLVLFLDDLQWADAATLGLLAQLVKHRDAGHLLLVGAYRDDEVTPVHPLAREVAAMRASGAALHEIELGSLRTGHVEQLITGTLHCKPGDAAALAELVREKTAGNPFFAVQFLHALAEDRLLRFDDDAARWSWDLVRIRARRYTDNVINLMVGRLHRLPGATHHLLHRLACLGTRADGAVLSIACDVPEPEVHARMLPAVRLGIVARTDGGYRFAHDRIHEAAYTAIPEASRREMHLWLGRVLLGRIAPPDREERIFEIVNQLNRGSSLMERRDERDELARLNLAAARRARAASAYASALGYLATGSELLAEEPWERDRTLAFELELDRAECEFLTGNPTAAEQRLSKLARRAATSTERAAVACLRINLQTTLDGSDHSVGIGLEVLRSFGVAWSPHPSDAEVRSEFDRMRQRLGERDIATLRELPRMTDPDRQAAMDVLTTLLPPALFTDANLLFLTVGRMANLGLEHGNCDGSCLAYVWLGLLLGPRFGDYDAALAFGRLGFDLASRGGFDRYRARVYLDFSHVVIPWMQHARTGPELVRRALDAANAIGDLNFAAYSSCNLVSALLAAGEPLERVQEEAERQLGFARSLRFGLIVDIVSGQLDLIDDLRGHGARAAASRPDRNELERRLDADPGLRVAIGWYWVRKLQGKVLLGDVRQAAQAAAKVEPHLWTMPSHIEVADFHFYAALARAAMHDHADEPERRVLVEAVRAHQIRLETWERNCPANFQARTRLVAAEVARLEGRELEAERLYEQAIHAAARHGFVHDEAIANEVAARFHGARGLDRIARAYLLDARQCYERWGATAKVRQLDDRYPHLRHAAPISGSSSTIVAAVERLDLATVLEISQAVTAEREPEKLLDRLMRTAIEQAGAERGVLMVVRDNVPTVEAEASIREGSIVVRVSAVEAGVPPLPQSIVQYVLRTGETVTLDDASTYAPFATDPYVQARQARSILCLPLAYRANLVAVLFLENNLAPGVFTPERSAVLKVLASLAAISLEHARLDADRRAHVWFLESVDRINRAIQANTDVARMMSDVLDLVLTTFGCDRAWLVYPCDPSAPAWRAVMEHTRPEFPGAFALGRDVPLDAEVADIFERALASRTSLRFGPAADATVPAHLEEDFDIRSFLAMAVHPRVDRPYLFGLHQCSHARRWSDAERRLFEEIGHRLADALTSLLMFRSLEESERKLEEAQRIAHVGYWEGDIESGDMTLSDEACRIHGLRPEELPRWRGRFQDLLHHEDRARVLQALAVAAQGGRSSELEYRVVRPNGEVRTLLARRNLQRDESGLPKRFFGMVQDITELRQAEEDRRASEARFRTLVEFAADAFFLQDEDGTLLDVNRQACAGLGYAREELIAMHVSDFDPGADETSRREIRERLAGGETVTFESRHRRKDGSEFPVEVRVRAFRQGGRMLRVSLARDISERKDAEAQRAHLEEELRRSQKMEAVGTLAGGIAHDFNNILGAILGYGELAQRKVREGRAIDEELDQVMQGGNRGKRLVEQILAFSRSGLGHQVPVHVQSVVTEALALLAASLPAGVRLQQRLAAGDA